MPMWRWTGSSWAKNDWHSLSVEGEAIICGAGHSIKSFTRHPEAFHICINSAYKEVLPDIWIGLDSPDFFGAGLLRSGFRKVFRGGMQDTKVDGVEAKRYHNSFFMDLREIPLETMFLNRTPDADFVWNGNSFIPAIQLALWMGYRRIGFAGVDLGGEHCDNAELTVEQINRNKLLWTQINSSLKSINDMARSVGIHLFSLTPDSRINEYLDTSRLK